MFYRFLQFIVPPFAFRVYFRRIFYSNLKKVPLEKPLLFVGNHQNSFIDGFLSVPTCLSRYIYHAGRYVPKEICAFLSERTECIPIYRMEEGFENVHKNIEAFTAIYDVLKITGILLCSPKGSASRKNVFIS